MPDTQLQIWEDPAKEIGEILIDEALDEKWEVLAKVPLLSLIISSVKSGKAWSDFLLARKVQTFYSAWEILNKTERKAIFEKFQKKPREFSEKLLFILAQQEDMAKCRVLGMLTINYLKGAIRRADYYDLIETIDKLSLGDLTKLSKLFKEGSMILPQRVVGERYAMLFVGRGLLQRAPRIYGEQRTSDDPDYQLTKLGETLGRAVV